MGYLRVVMLTGLGAGSFLLPAAVAAQTGGSPASSPQATAPIPLKVTLKDALQRARTMSPMLHLALTNVTIAAENRVQARATNLPIVSYNSQYLYTEGNGTPAARFIANNGVHEYIAQGNAHEVLSATQIAQYRRSISAEMLARDQAAITGRGLVVTVVESYAALVAAEDKLKTLEQARDAAQDFLRTTQQLESGGEVAHADVVKAEIQASDSEVALEDAQLALEQTRASLALLLFPDVNQAFEVVDNPGESLALPAFAAAQEQARSHNPLLEAAYDAERAASQDVTVAWAGYFPTLTFDYFYGIDANHFATQSPDREGPIRNLGYFAWAQFNLPVWNWGATHSKVKQAKSLKQQAIMDRGFAERKLAADLEQFYNGAKVAKANMEIRRRAAGNAEESRKLTLLRYKAGQATALEVVNAQDTVSLERNAFDDAQTRYATALANLATLTGSL